MRARDENLGAPKVTAPAAQPAGWVEHGFLADPTQTYKLWLRLKADNNHWSNDSVWVQFSGATDLSGRPAYRIGNITIEVYAVDEAGNRSAPATMRIDLRTP